jgi:hypothetical protein
MDKLRLEAWGQGDPSTWSALIDPSSEALEIPSAKRNSHWRRKFSANCGSIQYERFQIGPIKPAAEMALHRAVEGF